MYVGNECWSYSPTPPRCALSPEAVTDSVLLLMPTYMRFVAALRSLIEAQPAATDPYTHELYTSHAPMIS